MSSLVLINIELDIIRSFLNNVMITVDSEYANISAMVKAGEFPHYDDEANAYFKPQMWEQIAIRATLGELNALIEWELYGLASRPFFESEKLRKKGKYKIVSESNNIKEIITLIENCYQIKFSDISCYEHIEHIRKVINAFKHRKGFKDFRKDNCNSIGDKYKVSREDAFQSIEYAQRFLNELWAKTKKNPDDYFY